MSKNFPGLQYDKATDAWSIDKRIKGHGRIRQRLSAKTPEEDEKQFFQTIAQIQGEVYRREEGIMTFQEARDCYLDETQKRSIDRARDSLRFVALYLGNLPLVNVQMGTLQAFISDPRKNGDIEQYGQARSVYRSARADVGGTVLA